MKRRKRIITADHTTFDTSTNTHVSVSRILPIVIPELLSTIISKKCAKLLAKLTLNAIYEHINYIVLHHIDHDRSNNTPNNLVFLSSKAHGLLHSEQMYKCLLSYFGVTTRPGPRLGAEAKADEISMMRRLFNLPQYHACKLSQLTSIFQKHQQNINELDSYVSTLSDKELDSLAAKSCNVWFGNNLDYSENRRESQHVKYNRKEEGAEHISDKVVSVCSEIFGDIVRWNIKFVAYREIEDFMKANKQISDDALSDDERYAVTQFLNHNITHTDDEGLKKGLRYVQDTLFKHDKVIATTTFKEIDMQATKVDELHRLVSEATKRIEDATGNPCTFDATSNAIRTVDESGDKRVIFVGQQTRYIIHSLDGRPWMYFDSPEELAQTLESMLIPHHLTTL